MLPPELVVDGQCFLGMARPMTYYQMLSDTKKVLGTTMEIKCLAVPGEGRLTVVGAGRGLGSSFGRLW